MKLWAILVTLGVTMGAMCAPAVAAEVDDLGIRKFSAVPPVGVHPRVMLSPEDMADWRKQVITTHKGQAFFSKRYQSKVIDTLAGMDPAATDAQLVKLFPNAGPVHDLLFATMDAMYHNDAQRTAVVAKAVTNFARVVTARSKVDPRWGKVTDNVGGVPGLRGISTGLGTLWLRGGTSFALSYDFLFNDMTPEQRNVCRQALATATKDLVSWGMGFPKGRAVSNWYTYHGELGVMLLAIEGEEGFDKARYEMFTQMMHNWFDVSLYPDGGGNEDGYQANTGLRESTFSMIAMARRGDNLFRHPNYLPYFKWMVYSLIPGEHRGLTVSYACNAASPYESMPTLSRWAVPGDALVNYYFRQYKGADYSQNNMWQYSDMSTLFAMDWEDTAKLPVDATKLGLPLTAWFPWQGLMISRSDWTDNALYLNFYTRQDAWIDRHENIDRGRFSVCANGRQWIGTNWNKVASTENETIMHIDGKGQQALDERGRMVVPNGNMIARSDSELFSAGCMDLKRAYDWQWCNSFKNPGAGWEPETATFDDLGWTWKIAAMPKTLFGGDDAANPAFNFAGFNFWRKLANPVQHYFRTCAMARGAHPYVVIIDDIQKDAATHRYDSYLQVPRDVTLTTQADGSYVLSEVDSKADAAGARKMLLRLLGANDAKVSVEDYGVPGTQNKQEKNRRVVVSATTVSPEFKILLYPFRDGEALPAITTDPAKGTATIKWGNQTDSLSFARQENGLTQMNVARGGTTIFAGFSSFKIYPSAKPAGQANAGR